MTSRFDAGGTFITVAMEYLARDTELFQRPLSEVKDIYGIAKEIDPGYRVERVGPSMTKEKGADRAWEVFVPGSNARAGIIMTNADEVWIDVSRLQSGTDRGSAIYDMAAAYAHNNGKVLNGDPLGLSRMAYYRRNENMLSSALKYGTTRHLRPALEQEMPAEKFIGHEKAFGESVRPLKWIEGDDVNNIKEFIYNSYDAAIKNIPEIKDVVYNPASQQFERVSGEPFTDDDFDGMLSRYYGRADQSGGAGAAAGGLRVLGHSDQGNEQAPTPGGAGRLNPYRAGSSTIKRAAIFNTFLRGEGREGGRQVLGALVDQLSRDGLSPRTQGRFLLRQQDGSTSHLRYPKIWDSFTDAPIETPGMENVQPWLRAKPGTSDTMKAIGEATRNLPEGAQVPPARAEALLRGYFNTWAMYGLMLTDQAFYGKQLPERRTDEMPVVRRFYSAHPAKHTKYEKMFYEMLGRGGTSARHHARARPAQHEINRRRVRRQSENGKSQSITTGF